MAGKGTGVAVAKILGDEVGAAAGRRLDADWTPPKDFDENIKVKLSRAQKRRLKKALGLGTLRQALGNEQMDAVREGTLAELARRGYDVGDL